MTQPEPQPVPNARAQYDKGKIVLTVAELLRRPQGRPRDYALLSFMDYLNESGQPLPLTGLFISASAVLDMNLPDLDTLLPVEFVNNLMLQAEQFMEQEYPARITEPFMVQMKNVLVSLGEQQAHPRPVREVSAADVFGVQDKESR